jgi:hypothetical protein
MHGRFYARLEEDKAEWFTADWWLSGRLMLFDTGPIGAQNWRCTAALPYL